MVKFIVFCAPNHMEKYLGEILIDYVNFIEAYKNLVRNHNRMESDLIQMSTGKIGNYAFLYHGAGCRLEKDGIICEFDFLPENGFPVKFSTWKMYEFIRTNKKWNKLKFSLEEVHIGLLKLVEDKKLFLLNINEIELPIFQIKIKKTF